MCGGATGVSDLLPHSNKEDMVRYRTIYGTISQQYVIVQEEVWCQLGGLKPSPSACLSESRGGFSRHRQLESFPEATALEAVAYALLLS